MLHAPIIIIIISYHLALSCEASGADCLVPKIVTLFMAQFSNQKTSWHMHAHLSLL